MSQLTNLLHLFFVGSERTDKVTTKKIRSIQREYKYLNPSHPSVNHIMSMIGLLDKHTHEIEHEITFEGTAQLVSNGLPANLFGKFGKGGTFKPFIYAWYEYFLRPLGQ